MSTKKVHCLLCFALCAIALYGQEAPPLIDDPAMVQQLSLDIQINTLHSETAPVLSGDGKTLYFVREGHPNNIGDANAADIWASYLREDGAWSRAIHLPAPLNNRLPNRILATEVSGDVVYLADHYNSVNPRGLAVSVRNGRSWSKPQAMTIEGFVPGDGEKPHYQVDVTGNFLLLATTLPGGLGKRDLYVCFRKDALQWSKPLPLGAALNSSGDEAKTFLAADGRTLYFASDGRGGYGGLDWFHTFRQDESWAQWSEPKQLGKTINTPDDDQYLTVSHWGETAVVAREPKDGNSELMMITLPENLRAQPMTLVTGNVVDARTGLALGLPVAHRLYQCEGKEAPLNTKPGSPFALLAPSMRTPGGYICPKGYFATSSQFAILRGELQEVDVDPYGTFAATNLNPLYFQRESEIENLSLRLQQVDIELQEANQLRGIWRQKLEAARQTNPKAWKPGDDPELQALKHRYLEYLSRQRDTIVPPMQVLIAPKQEEISESAIPASFDHIGQKEDELTELRRRLQNHFQAQNAEKAAASPDGKYLWETDPPPFDEFSRGIRDSLRQKLYPEVQQQVSREVVAEVLAELARDPNAIPEQEAALREQIRQGLTSTTMSHAPLPGSQPSAPLKDWERLFASDIEKAVSDEVRTELAQEMRQDVKVALSIEATYLLKKEQSAKLRRALGEKVIQQIREEEKKMAEFSEEMPPPQSPQTEPQKIASPPQLQADIALLPIEEGQVILLNQVFFEANAAKLKAVSYAELDNVVEMLRQNPGMTIEIGAHTHGSISHALAMQLSSQRARVIADYLISKGIPKENVPYRGYGKMIPIAANDTPEGRKINQRIELNIIKLQ
ncbi:MAG: OmpA family protein [Saprospiraceae bacterium]|nr:OmpA family protein [Saprospiraceae bacterium]MDZ4705916.1 OmpA family protein [Saprospiraceae bacterium]